MKETNKDSRITVRLTPHQSFELDNIADRLKMKKSQIIRLMLDNFINKYYDAIGE